MRDEDKPRFSFVHRSEGDERSKFDFQLGEALKAEELLAQIFQYAKFELKTETWQWERTGNIAIEFRRGERRTGVDATEADYWVHELRIGEGDTRTACYLVLPLPILRELCKIAVRRGGVSDKGGDAGVSHNYLLRLSMLFSDLASIGHDKVEDYWP
jgi:hypothetical protein